MAADRKPTHNCACPHGWLRCGEAGCPREAWSAEEQRYHLKRHPALMRLGFPISLGEGVHVHAEKTEKH